MKPLPYKQTISDWITPFCFYFGLILLSSWLFRDVLATGHFLFTTDDNIGNISAEKPAFPSAFTGYWADASLVGQPMGRIPIIWTTGLMTLFPLKFFFNWIHAWDLIVASCFLALFLRGIRISWSAIALGVLCAFWLSCNLSTTYAGHCGKFAVLLCASGALFCIRQTMQWKHPWLWSMLAGGALGIMLLEQQDVALFFGIFLAAYALFLLTRNPQQPWIRRVGVLVTMGVMALLEAGPTLLQSYTQNIQNVSVVSQEAPQAKWEFVTQWSFPPEETMALLAPGFVGWRSGESEGPYYGRMGRSAGWETTGQGFSNFKLDDWYMGAIPLVFSLMAIFAAVWNNKATSSTEEWATQRAEVLFWGGVAIVTLLLSLGKFFPLYTLFYQLPVVNNIRNPVKFMQVFQVAVGILAAYAYHFCLYWQARQASTRHAG